MQVNKKKKQNKTKQTVAMKHWLASLTHLVVKSTVALHSALHSKRQAIAFCSNSQTFYQWLPRTQSPLNGRIGLEHKVRIQIGWLSFGKVSWERFLWPQLVEKNVDCQRGRVKSLTYKMNCEERVSSRNERCYAKRYPISWDDTSGLEDALENIIAEMS